MQILRLLKSKPKKFLFKIIISKYFSSKSFLCVPSRLTFILTQLQYSFDLFYFLLILHFLIFTLNSLLLILLLIIDIKSHILTHKTSPHFGINFLASKGGLVHRILRYIFL